MAIKTHTLLNKIVPELIDILDKRYTMLRTISVFQPIGRRNLSNYMGIGERIIRSDTYILRDAGLIEMDLAGMTLTREGEDLLEKLGGFLNELKGLADMETKIAEYLNIKNVIIVPGNLDEDKLVSNEIGKAAAIFLSRNMPRRGIVAVTGGSSVGAVAKSLGRIGKFPDLMLVPARGGIGREVDYQSNTIVSIFAKKMGCQYRLLHLPDQLAIEAAEKMLNEPDIKDVIQFVKNADYLIFGIGRADEMAKRRNLSIRDIDIINRSEAVAEAFGYYYNKNGDVVHTTNSLGLKPDELSKIPKSLAVAGGKGKAVVINAVLKNWSNCVLVTDEGAAREIIRLSDTINIRE